MWIICSIINTIVIGIYFYKQKEVTLGEIIGGISIISVGAVGLFILSCMMGSLFLDKYGDRVVFKRKGK